jgi:hypothetical protein
MPANMVTRATKPEILPNIELVYKNLSWLVQNNYGQKQMHADSPVLLPKAFDKLHPVLKDNY